MVDLYPPIEPYAQGMLAVGDGNAIAWELSGNPEGKPALLVHGGPGMGCSPNMRRAFDPARYRIILFDQRGCGRSIPHASDPSTDMSVNTTPHLIADMEALRTHLGVDRWLLSGGSWGSTLALAYAEAHPARVTEIVLNAVTTTRRSELDWLYHGVARFFPEAYERFRAHVPEAVRAEDVVAAYNDRMEHADGNVRLAAARAWCAWEDAVLSLEAPVGKGVYSQADDRDTLAFVRICTHYFRYAAWLEEGALIRGASKLAGIPGILIHGRMDMSGPIDTAWELSRAWLGAKLIAVEGAGHLGSDDKRRALLDALDGFAGAEGGR